MRDALRFPLGRAARSPRQARRQRDDRRRAAELPIPAAPSDPRRDALAATLAELERLGVPVAAADDPDRGGLDRRAGDREKEALLPPVSARRFHGVVEVHDAEAPDLVHLGDAGRTPLRVNRRLLETDLVVCVTAAETVLHGGPGALLGACGPETLRAPTAYSLLETAAARGWQLGLALERTLAARVPVIGASLVLNPPRLLGRFRGYPYEEASLATSSPPRSAGYSLLPPGLRRGSSRSRRAS